MSDDKKTHFDPEEELKKYLQEKQLEAQDLDAARDRKLAFEAAAAAASPNYDADMAIDAKGIAAFLEKQIGVPCTAVELTMGQAQALGLFDKSAGAGSPKPTLGSLLQHAPELEASFESLLTEVSKDRVKMREAGGCPALLHALHTGNLAAVRTYLKEKSDAPELSSAADSEMLAVLASSFQQKATLHAALGVYVGALLGEHLSLDEVLEVAADPLFQLKMVGLKVTRENVVGIALEVLGDVRQTQARARRSTGN